MTLDFERPLLLLLLPLGAAVVVWLWRTSRTYMPPFRRRAALGLRLAVLTLLTLALAGPLVQLRAEELAVAVLLDRSDSIPPAARAEQERWLADALAAKGTRDQVAVVTFGEHATLEQALSDGDRPPRLAPDDPAAGTRTDVAAAIRAGLAALPPGQARRLVLLSDGRENVEQADSAAALAAAAGVQVFARPLSVEGGPEVLMRQVDAPAQLREGERSSVTAQVQASLPTSARIHVLVDGTLAVSQDVALNAGVNRFPLPLEPLAVGHHVIRVQVEGDTDTLAQNNGVGAHVVVTGPPAVLVIEGSPGEGQMLAEALRAAGLRVDVANPTTAPFSLTALRSYASVVLANVAATDLGVAQMQTLKTYVQSTGGGLVVAGGEHAFGPGGYARTPLEEMLPVRMDLRGRSVSASVALMLVIDTSGSMGGGPGGTTKMDLAKEAAIAAAELLGEYDQIGIVAFEDKPRWVLQPTHADDLGAIQAAIADMQPGGGTEIYPALSLAYDGLAPLDAKVKHIILLTDGQAPKGDYPGLTAQMRAASISLSTIAIGADADFALLQSLADQGDGRYYEGNDPFDLPRLVVKETQQVQRAAIVEEDFRPARVATTPILEGIDPNSMPELRGYVATTPKPQSSVLLISRQADPVLAEWQFGLGRVIAWTSDATNRWASRWLEWPQFSQFWAQVVKRTTRPPDDPNRQVTVTLDGNQARIRLDAQTGVEAAERQYLNFLPTTAEIVGPRGDVREITLPQVAPGRYEAETPVEDDGVYALEVQQTEPDGGTATQSSGFVVPYSPEYRDSGTDTARLEAIAKRTGGKLIREPAEAFVHDLPSVGAPRPLWPTLLMLTALVFVLDVAVRRIRITGPEARSAYWALRHRLGLADPVPVAAPPPHYVRPATSPTLLGATPAPAATAPPVEVGRQGRLLAAKRRALRH